MQNRDEVWKVRSCLNDFSLFPITPYLRKHLRSLVLMSQLICLVEMLNEQFCMSHSRVTRSTYHRESLNKSLQQASDYHNERSILHLTAFVHQPFRKGRRKSRHYHTVVVSQNTASHWSCALMSLRKLWASVEFKWKSGRFQYNSKEDPSFSISKCVNAILRFAAYLGVNFRNLSTIEIEAIRNIYGG